MDILKMKILIEERRLDMLAEKLTSYMQFYDLLREHSFNCFICLLEGQDFIEILKYFQKRIRETNERIAHANDKIAYLNKKKLVLNID